MVKQQSINQLNVFLRPFSNQQSHKVQDSIWASPAGSDHSCWKDAKWNLESQRFRRLWSFGLWFTVSPWRWHWLRRFLNVLSQVITLPLTQLIFFKNWTESHVNTITPLACFTFTKAFVKNKTQWKITLFSCMQPWSILSLQISRSPWRQNPSSPQPIRSNLQSRETARLLNKVENNFQYILMKPCWIPCPWNFRLSGCQQWCGGRRAFSLHNGALIHYRWIRGLGSVWYPLQFCLTDWPWVCAKPYRAYKMTSTGRVQWRPYGVLS